MKLYMKIAYLLLSPYLVILLISDNMTGYTYVLTIQYVLSLVWVFISIEDDVLKRAWK